MKKSIKRILQEKHWGISMYILKHKILFKHRKTQEQDVFELLCNLKEQGVKPFLGDFAKKYEDFDVSAYREENNGYFWVIHNGEKLYFSDKANQNRVKRIYTKLCKEQDIASPHRYVKDYSCLQNCYVIEAGAAEASFSLDAISNNCKKVYICECDEEWIPSLNKTFERFGSRAEIIQKYVSDTDSETSITIDSILRNAVEMDGLDFEKDKIFIKMDIEGMEMAGVNGMQNSLKKAKHISCAICTYHKQDDESKIRALFPEEYWNIETSSGYMLFPYDKQQKSPYLRRGVLRVTKK